MTKPIARLMCAADVDDEPVVVDGRFPAAYASSSAALLVLFSAEVMRGKRWGTWGMPAAHFPAFRAFVGVYSVWREASLVEGAFERGVKEVICACVSASNECHFCANGHAVCARLGGVEGAMTLVRERTTTHITDERMRSLAAWALAFRDPDAPIIRHPPPMSTRDAAELLGSVLHTVYKNVFAKVLVGAGPLPDAFPAAARAASGNAVAMAGFNKFFATFVMARPAKAVPNRCREVWARLPDPFDPAAVALPDDLWWAAPNTRIADAVRFVAAEQAAIEARWLPPPVASAVRRYVATAYHGQEMGAADDDGGGGGGGGGGATAPPAWATRAVAADVVGDDDAFLAAFLLTAGLSASAVGPPLLQAFRVRFRDRAADVELMLREGLSWVAWTVARRTVGWIAAHASPRAAHTVALPATGSPRAAHGSTQAVDAW